MSTLTLVQNYQGSNSFVLKMKDVISKYGKLTVSQAATVEKILNAPVEAKQVELTEDMKKIQAYALVRTLLLKRSSLNLRSMVSCLTNKCQQP
jgi:hypothetical protein